VKSIGPVPHRSPPCRCAIAGNGRRRVGRSPWGCVLYQCLTGQLPFPRTTMEQVAMAHMLDPSPKPSTQQPGVRNGFDDRPAARRLTLPLLDTRCLGMPPDPAAVNHQQRRTHEQHLQQHAKSHR
jgi:hypothetical protein